MSEWQTIETAPKDGTVVLLYTPGYGRWIGKCERAWRIVMSKSNPVKPHEKSHESSQFDIGPTHWLPLPEPPSEDKPTA